GSVRATANKLGRQEEHCHNGDCFVWDGSSVRTMLTVIAWGVWTVSLGRRKTAVRLHLVMLSAVMSVVVGDAAAQTVSSGTAFSVAPEVLITNRHVVKGCSSVDVISSDGRRTASIAASDADIDLGILRVSGLRGTPATLRDPTAGRRRLLNKS